MILYSPFFKPTYWIVMGLLYALMVAGAPVWAEELGLQMNWWKWILAVFWYMFLSFSLAGGATLLGEKEPQAWYRFFGFHLIIAAILGIIIWIIL